MTIFAARHVAHTSLLALASALAACSGGAGDDGVAAGDPLVLVGGGKTPVPSGLDPAPASIDWSTPASLSVNGCMGAGANGPCGLHSASFTRGISWGTSIAHTLVTPTAKVRFGPFHLSKTILDYSGVDTGDGIGSGPPVTFTISVYGRSPAVYGTTGSARQPVFTGAHADLVEIGRVTETLTSNGSKDIYLTATMPSIFTALQIRARLDYGSAVNTVTSSFPPACGNAPLTPSDSATLDNACMEVAVNPLAMLAPHWVPLSILYEPPGNCSWANFTQAHTAGAAITMQESKATSTHTLVDTEVFGITQDKGDYTDDKVSATQRTTQVTVDTAQSVGTRFGLPLESPGNTACNSATVVPPRTDAGPGKGDVFILLRNPSAIYWDTADLTNFLLTQQGKSGSVSNVVAVTAQQIATGVGLPPGVSFTAEERDAILALDPFTQTTPPKTLPPRFVFLNEIVSLGQGVAIEQSLTNAYINTDGQTLTSAAKTLSSTSEEESLAFTLSMKGLAYGGGVAAGAATGAILGWIGSGADPGVLDFFGKVADGVKDVGIPQLYTHQVDTTVATTYSRSSLIDKASSSAITQRFFIQDTNQGMSLGIYYDTFFGTFAFLPQMPDLGKPISPVLGRLPAFAWSIDAHNGEALVRALPSDVATSLAALGTVRLEGAPATAYVSVRGTPKGLPLGMTLDPATKQLSGAARMFVGEKHQALFWAIDAHGATVAQVWVNVNGAL